jgi:hypothetical protein
MVEIAQEGKNSRLVEGMDGDIVVLLNVGAEEYVRSISRKTLLTIYGCHIREPANKCFLGSASVPNGRTYKSRSIKVVPGDS